LRILALLLLSGSFLFFPVTPLYAQHYHGMSLCSCQQQQAYDASGVESDEQYAIEKLEKKCKELNEKLESLESGHDYLGDILDLQDKLKQTKLDLYTAQLRIETLENQVSANQEHMEEELTALLMARHPVSNTKAGVSKPKAPVNQAKPADPPKNR
jgi:peptidoglycan hydrolase CwlO-like protein